MSEVNPKEMALMLFKLTIENNAMLQQCLMEQAEIIKFLKIIHVGTNGEWSEKLAKQLEMIHEQGRQDRIEVLANLATSLEAIKLETIKTWLADAIQSGELKGSINDYDYFQQLGKIPTVSTASHD